MSQSCRADGTSKSIAPPPLARLSSTDRQGSISLTSSLTIDSPAYSTAISNSFSNISTSTTGKLSNSTSSRTRNTNNTSHSSSSIIHDKARVTDWRQVQALATSQPHNASYKCDHGLTALHHTCTRRCPVPSVFQALIQAYPHAIIEQDDGKGWTPLHHACRFKCPLEGIKLLLQSYPDYGRHSAKVRDKEKGRTALYYAIRYNAPDGVVDMLLGFMDRVDILDCDRDGMSVLGLVWDKWVVSYEGKRIMAHYIKIFDQWNDAMKEASNDEERENAWKKIVTQSSEIREGLKGKLKDSWEKVNLILRGAFRFDFNGNSNNAEDAGTSDANNSESLSVRKWRILHAISAIQCHPSLFLMASILHPEQARELDRFDLLRGDQQTLKGTSGSTSASTSASASTSNLASHQIQTALHFAAKSPTCGSESKVVLKRLLLFYPEAVKMKNPGDESLPLHYLCENESKQHWVHDGIRDVYDSYPEAVTITDVDGRTPLHRAATLHESSIFFNPPPPPSIMSTPTRITSSSRSYSSGDATNTNASSSVRTGNSNFITSVEDPVGSIIQNILSSHPEVASIPDVSGKVLLHYIAECAESWDQNVQAIYDAYPEALSRRESVTRGLPLHLVASNLDAKTRLLQKIVEYHPRAASLVNGDGRLPLHLACETGKTWYSGLEDIYNAYNNAVNVAEEGGLRWTPLHFVVSSPYSSVETIERILGLGPDVAHVVDQLGRTPFHLAVESGKEWEEGGLQSLFQANPEAIDVPDTEGKIPLVTALLGYCSDQCVPDGNEFDASENSTSSVPFTDNSNNLLDDGQCTGEGECDVIDSTHVSQVNVVFHLLRAAPHVLAPMD